MEVNRQFVGFDLHLLKQITNDGDQCDDLARENQGEKNETPSNGKTTTFILYFKIFSIFIQFLFVQLFHYIRLQKI